MYRLNKHLVNNYQGQLLPWDEEIAKKHSLSVVAQCANPFI